MPDRRYTLPDIRLVAIRTWMLCLQYHFPADRVREMPPLAEIDRLVAEIDAAREKAGQD